MKTSTCDKRESDTATKHRCHTACTPQSLNTIIHYTHLQKLLTYLECVNRASLRTNIGARLIMNKPERYCPSFCLSVRKSEACRKSTDNGCCKNRSCLRPRFCRLFISSIQAAALASHIPLELNFSDAPHQCT